MRPVQSGEILTEYVLSTTGYDPANAIAIPCNGFRYITFGLGYLIGGANGAMRYAVEFQLHNNWFRAAYIEPSTLTAGSDQVNLIQRVEQEYTAIGSPNREFFTTHTYYVPGRNARVLLQEIGNLGAPGTITVEYFLNGAI